MSHPIRISYAFMAALLLLIAVFGLATPLITVLFSLFALNLLNFRGQKWLAVGLFMVLITAISFGVVFFVSHLVAAGPTILERLIPRIMELAQRYHIELPFSDVETFRAVVADVVVGQFRLVGSSATRLIYQVAFVVIGIVVAVSLFHNSMIVIDRETHILKNNLYLLTADEIGERFRLFFISFSTVMGAQIMISGINTVLTGIFLFSVGIPFAKLLVVVTFLCGLLPILGNILSNTVIVCVALTVDPQHAVGALAFLMIIHKLEYFLNSKIIGARIRNPMWLTMLALVLGERLMGVPGMILAPVILHYIKMETSSVAVEHLPNDALRS